MHTTEGKIIGVWGIRKWMQLGNTTTPKRINLYIAQQSLLHQLSDTAAVQWVHQLVALSKNKSKKIQQYFKLPMGINAFT